MILATILDEAVSRYVDNKLASAFVQGATWVKAMRVEPMQQRINALEAENQRLAALLREVKPLKEAP